MNAAARLDRNPGAEAPDLEIVMIQTIIEDEPQAASEIEIALLRDLRATLQQAENSSMTFTARNPAGELVGGVSAGTSYGWLLIKTLWVAAEERRSGLGSRLLTAAEERGRMIGCHSAWLDTSNPQSAEFYARRGYVPFGELSNPPGQFLETHRRAFMKKTLLP